MGQEIFSEKDWKEECGDKSIRERHQKLYTQALLLKNKVEELESTKTRLEREVSKLNNFIELKNHAVDLWVPCPDHRDKVDRRIGCYMCANERLQRKLTSGVKT